MMPKYCTRVLTLSQKACVSVFYPCVSETQTTRGLQQLQLRSLCPGNNHVFYIFGTTILDWVLPESICMMIYFGGDDPQIRLGPRTYQLGVQNTFAKTETGVSPFALAVLTSPMWSQQDYFKYPPPGHFLS